MSQKPVSPTVVLVNTAALLGVLLIMAGLIAIMYYYTRPEPPDRARWAERKKAYDEIQAASLDALDNYALVDPTRGQVRLPIRRAMDLTAIEWQDPVSGRSNLLARLEKLTPPPPVLPAATNAPPTNAPSPVTPPKPTPGAK